MERAIATAKNETPSEQGEEKARNLN